MRIRTSCNFSGGMALIAASAPTAAPFSTMFFTSTGPPDGAATATAADVALFSTSLIAGVGMGDMMGANGDYGTRCQQRFITVSTAKPVIIAMIAYISDEAEHNGQGISPVRFFL
jgi:hypothetical protein